MSCETSRVEGSGPTPPCLQKIIKSKWTDVALIADFAALLVIGILASTGIFNFIGTTNATCLSYGMYGGAILFFIAEIIKFAFNNCHKNFENGLWRQPSNRYVHVLVPVNYTSPQIRRSEPLTLDEINVLKRRAKIYVQDYYISFLELDVKCTPEVIEEARRRELNFILNIIWHVEFQKDPIAYLEAMKQQSEMQGKMHLLRPLGYFDAVTFFIGPGFEGIRDIPMTAIH